MDDQGNAELSASRAKLPYVREGDQIVLPRRRILDVPATTGNRYYFRLKHVTRLVRLRFLHASGKARANEPYLCAIGLRSGKTEEHRSQTTDSNGFLIEPVPADTVSLEVTIGAEEPDQEVHRVWLADYIPAEETEGLQRRLSALGYYVGDVDGELGPVTQEALAAFQEDAGLTPTGEANDATRRRLTEVFGS